MFKPKAENERLAGMDCVFELNFDCPPSICLEDFPGGLPARASLCRQSLEAGEIPWIRKGGDESVFAAASHVEMVDRIKCHSALEDLDQAGGAALELPGSSAGGELKPRGFAGVGETPAYAMILNRWKQAILEGDLGRILRFQLEELRLDLADGKIPAI